MICNQCEAGVVCMQHATKKAPTLADILVALNAMRDDFEGLANPGPLTCVRHDDGRNCLTEEKIKDHRDACPSCRAFYGLRVARRAIFDSLEMVSQ